MWYKFAQDDMADNYGVRHPGFVNIYDSEARVAILAEPVGDEGMTSLLTRAYYEFGLTNPDYQIFQTKDQALSDASTRGIVGEQ